MSSKAETSLLKTESPRALRLGLSEVWVRFLVAIFGLVLAFGAALFSSPPHSS